MNSKIKFCGSVRDALQRNSVKIGDIVLTEQIGDWPGGLSKVMHVGPEDLNAPEICLYVKSLDKEIAEKFHNMGCFENECLTIYERAKKCDCGAKVARTTHAYWCSIKD